MRLILLGTGTAVGKTTVARALLGLFRPDATGPLKSPVLGLKPIETGFPARDDLAPDPESDAAQLEAAAFHVQHPRPHPLYAFGVGLSPHLAAERAGRGIDLRRVATWLDAAEVHAAASGTALTVIETAGGVFSPLTLTARNFDLALLVRADLWLLVAPDRLGVLHDVAATTNAMAHLGRKPDALVLARPASDDASTGSNAAELRRLHPDLPVLSLPASQPSDAEAAGSHELRAWILARLQH